MTGLSTKSIAACLLLACGITFAAHAQYDAQSILDSASDESARLRELAVLFQHPDPAVRYEAFRVLSQSEHPLERDLAFQSALGSTDVNLRSLAIIRRLEEMNPLVVSVSRGEAPSESFDRLILNGNETAILSLPQHSFDARTGTFVVGCREETPPSQVIGDEVRLALTHCIPASILCSGRLPLVDGTALEGSLDCAREIGRVSVRIDLYY